MDLIIYISGLLTGMVIMGIASARAYEKGARDGYDMGCEVTEQALIEKWRKGE